MIDFARDKSLFYWWLISHIFRSRNISIIYNFPRHAISFLTDAKRQRRTKQYWPVPCVFFHIFPSQLVYLPLSLSISIYLAHLCHQSATKRHERMHCMPKEIRLRWQTKDCLPFLGTLRRCCKGLFVNFVKFHQNLS